jgi:hypothetical protein
MTKKTKPLDGMQSNNAVTVSQSPDETGAQAMARKLLEPHLRHAVSASTFAGKVLSNDIVGPGIMDFVDHLQKVTAKAEGGDLAIASRLLAAQALTLDSMFSELARRAALNMGEDIGAAESYGRLALKAQSNCRATLETLAKLHQPREQTVRHVHVNEGGQAVITDQFHNHTGGKQNGKTYEQPHAIEGAGAAFGQPLRSENAQRDAVPLASDA